MKLTMSRLANGSKMICSIAARDKAASKSMPLISRSAFARKSTCTNATYSTTKAPFSASDLFDLKERVEEKFFFNKLDDPEIQAFKEKARAEVMVILSGKFVTLLNISDYNENYKPESNKLKRIAIFIIAFKTNLDFSSHLMSRGRKGQ
jgi:hypothetical protein